MKNLTNYTLISHLQTQTLENEMRFFGGSECFEHMHIVNIIVAFIVCVKNQNDEFQTQ